MEIYSEYELISFLKYVVQKNYYNIFCVSNVLNLSHCLWEYVVPKAGSLTNFSFPQKNCTQTLTPSAWKCYISEHAHAAAYQVDINLTLNKMCVLTQWWFVPEQ